MKKFFITGNNKDNFIMLKIPYQLEKDTFIRTIEIIPGNKKLVHHINAHLVQYENGAKKNYSDGKTFVDTEKSNKLQAYDPASGKLLWSVETTEDPNHYWLRAKDGNVYSWSTDQQKVWNSSVTVETQLTAYDLNTGTYLWRKIADLIGAPGSFVKDKIIVTVDGGIEALPEKR